MRLVGLIAPRLPLTNYVQRSGPHPSEHDSFEFLRVLVELMQPKLVGLTQLAGLMQPSGT